MVGIDIDHISMARQLPIRPAALAAVVARLRAETSGTTLHWNLGNHGRCALDVLFAPGDGSSLTASARLWRADDAAPLTVAVLLLPRRTAATVLELRAAEPAGPWSDPQVAPFATVACAALDELEQELLFQHARVQDELAS
jgi:hypothetical protein